MQIKSIGEIFPCINTSGLERQWLWTCPCTILDFRDLPPPGFIISAFSTSSTAELTLHKLALHISLLYICMNCTFPFNSIKKHFAFHIFFFSCVNISFRSWWPNALCSWSYREHLIQRRRGKKKRKQKCLFNTLCASHFFAYVRLFFFPPRIN